MKKFKDQESVVGYFEGLFNQKKSLVKIKVSEVQDMRLNSGHEVLISFQAKFEIPQGDLFVDRKLYDEGHACIYLSDNFYKEIESLIIGLGGQKPNWNNTGTHGWFRYRFEEKEKAPYKFRLNLINEQTEEIEEVMHFDTKEEAIKEYDLCFKASIEKVKWDKNNSEIVEEKIILQK